MKGEKYQMKKKSKIIIAAIVLLLVISVAIGLVLNAANNARYITAEEAVASTFLSMTDGEGNIYFGPETTISILEAGDRGVIDYKLTQMDVLRMSTTGLSTDSESDWKQAKILKADYLEWLQEQVTYTSIDGESEKMTRAEGIEKTNNTIKGQLGID